MAKKDILLHYASTRDSSFLFKKTGINSPSPLVYYKNSGESIYVPLFEFDYFDRYARIKVKPITSLPDYKGKLAKSLIALLKKEAARVFVPASFPVWLFNDLKEALINIKISDYYFTYPDVIKKDEAEIKIIRKNAVAAQKCFSLIRGILKKSRVSEKGLLYCGSELLTSQKLARRIRCFLAEFGMVAEWVVIASGKYGFYPHCTINHSLEANKPIIIDIAFKDADDGYFIDSARTFCKGIPGDFFNDLHGRISEIKSNLEKMIKPGLRIADFSKAGNNLLNMAGIDTATTEKTLKNVFPLLHHSLGHGLGRDLHQLPVLNSKACVDFEENMVIALEPGAYIKDKGGIRIEDTYLITSSGAENLTSGNVDFIIL